MSYVKLILPSQFAIRPTLRNHNVLTRDSVIRQIASLVGPGHTVDLKGYELLIVVEVYQVSFHHCTIRRELIHTDALQNICGVSVVDSDFERLKRYNLAEIFEPTPKEVVQQVKETLAEPSAPSPPIEKEGDEMAPVRSTSSSMDLT